MAQINVGTSLHLSLMCRYCAAVPAYNIVMLLQKFNQFVMIFMLTDANNFGIHHKIKRIKHRIGSITVHNNAKDIYPFRKSIIFIVIPFLKVYIALAVLIKYENEVILAIAALVNVPRISLNCCCICANV